VRDFIRITKALADPSRVRMLLALQRGELCVCQIVELSRLAPSTVSKHLSLLHHAGLIASRKDERWVYYRLPGKEAPLAVREAIAWAHKSLSQSTKIESDRKALKQILQQDPSAICRRQGRR
jgi:ArsR family transcriptional regulator, arsenate/arsenite/antimonite-responsive transcriptional repressor